MNELKIFNNPDFGQVRMMMIEDTPYFVGKDVAEMLGISTSHYACIEQGTHNPSTKLVKVFCNVFGKENASLIIGS